MQALQLRGYAEGVSLLTTRNPPLLYLTRPLLSAARQEDEAANRAGGQGGAADKPHAGARCAAALMHFGIHACALRMGLHAKHVSLAWEAQALRPVLNVPAAVCLASPAAVPLAIGGALPDSVQLRDDLPSGGLANVAGGCML